MPEQQISYQFATKPQGQDEVQQIRLSVPPDEPLPSMEELQEVLATMAAARPPLSARVSRGLGTAVVICGLLLVLFGIALAAYALYSWVVG